MTPRGVLTVAGALGAIWALGVVWVGATQINLPIFSLTPVLLVGFLGPGLFLALMILLMAVRRYMTQELHDGSAGHPGSKADVDAKVLQNTIEQTVLALCLWPAIGFLAADDGPGLIAALAVSFPLSRLAYWTGYRISPPLRMAGFSATFCATIFALAWAFAVWFV